MSKIPFLKKVIIFKYYEIKAFATCGEWQMGWTMLV